MMRMPRLSPLLETKVAFANRFQTVKLIIVNCMKICIMSEVIGRKD